MAFKDGTPIAGYQHIQDLLLRGHPHPAQSTLNMDSIALIGPIIPGLSVEGPGDALALLVAPPLLTLLPGYSRSWRPTKAWRCKDGWTEASAAQCAEALDQGSKLKPEVRQGLGPCRRMGVWGWGLLLVGSAGGARGAGRGCTCAAGCWRWGGERRQKQLRAPPRGLLPAAAAP